MAEILKQRLGALDLSQADQRELRMVLESLVDGVRAIAAKLDADAANTALNDTDYAATFDGFITK
jgi:hypothetical protein